MQTSLSSLFLVSLYSLAFLEQLHGFAPSSGILVTLLGILGSVTTGIVPHLPSLRRHHRHPMTLIESLTSHTPTNLTLTSYAAAQTRLIRDFLYINPLYRPDSTLLLGIFVLVYLQDSAVARP